MKKVKVLLVVIFCLLLIYFSTVIGIASIPISTANKILLNKLLFIPFSDSFTEGESAIIFSVRLPRIILAFLTGSSLAVCGVSYQAIFKNPMADPYILGVSSGAAFGASLGIIFNINSSYIGLSSVTIISFLSAILTIFLVFNISKINNKVTTGGLLLSGIAFSQTISALMSLLMIFNLKSLQQIYVWTMGSLNGKGWRQILIILPYLVIGLFLIIRSTKEMDIMLLGEETAHSLGVEVEKLKRKVIVASTLITAAVVSVTGVIGFVGLIIPHLSRLLFGPKHSTLYPISFLLGGSFLVVCDTLSRSLTSQEIPVGIITALIGGPFFIYLLIRSRRARNE